MFGLESGWLSGQYQKSFSVLPSAMKWYRALLRGSIDGRTENPDTLLYFATALLCTQGPQFIPEINICYLPLIGHAAGSLIGQYNYLQLTHKSQSAC